MNKIQLEEIRDTEHSSLRLMVNPNLSDFFFWHFHPEYELVYIEGADGTRHVGEHYSKFNYCDLVLIGSNIPHLNFDYGIKTSYQKRVVHLREDFKEQVLERVPEMADILRLFKEAAHGVSFSPKVKVQVASKIMNLHKLAPFQQVIEVLRILEILSGDEQRELLHEHPVENPVTFREKQRIRTIYQFIEINYQRKIRLDEAAALSNLSKEAFCRYFKKMTKLTFTQFVNHYRIDTAKKLLLQGSSITDACFDSGFESIPYFNKIFKKITGTNPLGFKRMHTKQ